MECLHLSAKRHRFIIWWGRRLKGPIIPVWFIGWESPFCFEGSVKNPSIWKESLPWIVSSDTLCTREEFGRVTYWSQTLRSWKRMDASEIYSKRLNAKEMIFPKEKNYFFQSQMDESKPLRGDQELRTSTLITAATDSKEMVTLTFLENQKGLFHNLTTRFQMPVEAINDFWSMLGSFIYLHHVDPRVKLYSPRGIIPLFH